MFPDSPRTPFFPGYPKAKTFFRADTMTDDDSSRKRAPGVTYGTAGNCPDGISFIEHFLVDDAPPELEEVEAAIDAEPRPWWVRWVRLGAVALSLGFWALVIHVLFW